MTFHFPRESVVTRFPGRNRGGRPAARQPIGLDSEPSHELVRHGSHSGPISIQSTWERSQTGSEFLTEEDMWQ
ncbi:hypothetical protein GCM10027436_24740 [Actinophytocola sediminis]